MALTIYRCPIHQCHINVRCVDSAEQGSVVSQIAPAERERHVNRYGIEVVVAIVVVAYSPGIAAGDAVQTLDGIDDGGGSLAQETAEAAVAVVKNGTAQTVAHFTDSHTAATGSYDVVDGRWLRLAEQFPHERTSQGVGCRLPECQAVGTCRIEVEVAMIGVQEKVGDEEVVVPYKACLEVMPDAVQRGLGEIRLDDIAVEQLHAHVDARHLGCSLPVAFLHG